MHVTHITLSTAHPNHATCTSMLVCQRTITEILSKHAHPHASGTVVDCSCPDLCVMSTFPCRFKCGGVRSCAAAGPVFLARLEIVRGVSLIEGSSNLDFPNLPKFGLALQCTRLCGTLDNNLCTGYRTPLHSPPTCARARLPSLGTAHRPGLY